MITETFLEKFELIADSQDAVPQMRELVLELAMQGKLVDQVAAEGDGHTLLKEIHQKNLASATDGETEQVANAEAPELPESWAHSRLGEVAEIVRGVTFPGSAKSTSRSTGNVACLRTASVQAEIDWNDLIYISPEYVTRLDQWVGPRDIIISMANSYDLVGKVAIVRSVPEKATFGGFLAAIRPVLIEPYFLLYALRSPRMQQAFRVSSSQTTNIANISLGRMRPLPFPLPPLAEQKRIVAKVDELMGLCDRLEAQQTKREQKHAALARASLFRFAESPTTANLEFLFHDAYTIDPADLRKSIITLAVKGKLVPQEPEEGTAQASFPGLQSLESNAGIVPPHWARCAYRSLTSLVTSGSRGWKEYYAKSGALFIRTQNIKTDSLVLDDVAFVQVPELNDGKRAQVQQDDILITVTGANVTKAARVEAPIEEAYVSQHIALTRPCWKEMSPWLHLCFISPGAARGTLERLAYGDKPGLNLDNIRDLVLPIPPLGEQRRIVAKVDQLMALVDQLETHLATSRATVEKLMEAVVAELTVQGRAHVCA